MPVWAEKAVVALGLTLLTCRILVRFCRFVERGLDRIAWESVRGNLDSARVARAVGFRFLGDAPVELAFRDGSHPDGWHAELRRDDDGSVREGWPL